MYSHFTVLLTLFIIAELFNSFSIIFLDKRDEIGYVKVWRLCGYYVRYVGNVGILINVIKRGYT